MLRIRPCLLCAQVATTSFDCMAENLYHIETQVSTVGQQHDNFVVRIWYRG